MAWQQRPVHEEPARVQLVLQARAVLAGAQGLGGADVQELAGVVPLVDGLVDVYALVALEPDQGRVEHPAEDLGHLGLADPGLALKEERLLELEGQEDRRRQPLRRPGSSPRAASAAGPENAKRRGAGPPGVR
jgi:hypothetical protein